MQITEMLSELQRLNHHRKVDLGIERYGKKLVIVSNKETTNLSLPNKFYPVKGGITNKFNDSEAVFFEVLVKTA